MAYTIARDGQDQVRYLYGARPFSELLTRGELEQVERGELVGVSECGAVLALSSPLEEGATVTLRAPDPRRDLATIGVPANRRGELVGVAEALEIRCFELEHGVDLGSRSLAEIRADLAAKKDKPRAGFFAPGALPRKPRLERVLGVDSQPSPVRRRLVPLAGCAA